MDDLISRQAAIDALNEKKIYRPLDSDRWVIADCLEAIVKLPSAQPERKTGRWTDKKILDVTCGNRGIWFQKNEPHTIYCDRRYEEWEINVKGKNPHHKELHIHPDVVCDFTEIPFDDNSFSLVVFDPPHVENLSDTSWFKKEYGGLDGEWRPMIKKGFHECMRVLKDGGVLIFKWSDISVSTRDIIKVIGQEPLFGHRSGKKMNTHWMCFMKFDCGAKMEVEHE